MTRDLQRLIIEEKEKETAAVDTAALTAGKGTKKVGKKGKKKKAGGPGAPGALARMPVKF